MHTGLNSLITKLGVEIVHEPYRISAEEANEYGRIMGQVLPDGTPMYDHISDKIFLPDGFSDSDHVLAHELIHWTGHKSRLGRFDELREKACCPGHSYRFEELVAEIGRELLIRELDIPPIDRNQLIAHLAMSSGMHPHAALDLAADFGQLAIAYIFEQAELKKAA